MLLQTLLFIFLAEIADKTQLMMIALTNRYRIKTVVCGMILGVLLISGFSVLAGNIIGEYIPMDLIKCIAGILFLLFGFLNLRYSDKKEKGTPCPIPFPIVSISFTFMLAELGDKTQLASVALAADHMNDHIAIFIGASLGLILANMLGMFAGKLVFAHIKEDSVKVVASFFFFLFGSITLFEALPVPPLFLIVYSCIVILCAYSIFTTSRKEKLT